MKSKKVEIQKGHIYIKMSEYYTATVRSLEDLKRFLDDEKEDKSVLEILDVYNVSKIFEREVSDLVANYMFEKKENIFVSFSGGESSAYLLLEVLKRYEHANILVCFSNTGDENEETLVFVQNICKYYGVEVFWLEAYVSPVKGKGVMPVIVDFETASRDGKPLLDQAEKSGHCAISAPHCTRDLKVRAMHKFVKNYFRGHEYVTMQGIRYDEQTRVNWEKAKKNNWEYPLIKWRVTKPMINEFWKSHKKEHGFRLNLEEHQGNCNLCFKKSEKKLIKLIREKPCLLIFRFALELVSSTDKHDMYRKNRTTMDYLELARSDEKVDDLDEFGGACVCS